MLFNILILVMDYITISVLTLVPSSPPVNVESAVLSSSVISVSWEEVPPIDQNGIITDYEVLLEPLETSDGVLSPITSNTTNFDIEIMDLMPFVSYNISVRAYTSEGPGPYSEPISNTISEEGTHAILKCEILLDSVRLHKIINFYFLVPAHTAGIFQPTFVKKMGVINSDEILCSRN